MFCADRIKEIVKQTTAVLLTRRTCIRLIAFVFIFLIILFYFMNRSPTSQDIDSSQPTTGPTIARVLYLLLCENQEEIDAYIYTFPSITADVMFICWRDNCFDTNFSKPLPLNVSHWTGPTSKYQLHVNSVQVQPRVFILNEKQMSLSKSTTWTTARNLLLATAMAEEHRQGWRWAYFNFGDGDIQVDCPMAQKLLQSNQTDGDEIVLADHFRSLINRTINKDECFVLFDSFLLSVSPAIAVIDSMGTEEIYVDLFAQIVYHVDAMFNAFHRDAIPFVLPYCARYDQRSWATSQAILVYRSLCLYGHIIQLNSMHVTRQIHRPYPQSLNPWEMDNDMNFVPPSLLSLQSYMQQGRVISPLVLRFYSGWSLARTSEECRLGYTSIDPLTCNVTGGNTKTNF